MAIVETSASSLTISTSGVVITPEVAGISATSLQLQTTLVIHHHSTPLFLPAR